MITVRYFAAAAEAAGVDTETFDTGTFGTGTFGTGSFETGSFDTGTFGTGTSDAATITTAGLRRAMVAAHGADLERVLARCSLLAAGRRLPDDDAPVPDGVTVDVLPPFAGG